MKLIQILNELSLALTSKTPIGKKLKQYRGINYIVLGEKDPPDIMGMPPKFDAYGRGYLDSKSYTIRVDGGAQGSAQGHPGWAKQGFYWGANQEARWLDDKGISHKGAVYVRGRAGTDENWIKRNIYSILNAIFNRLPKS